MSTINRSNISIDLDFSTKPGRPIFGRYMAMYIYNKSASDIESCFVILEDVKALKGNWKPDKRIKYDPLLWGSLMVNRNGLKTIKKNNRDDTLVDILHTSDNKAGGHIFFTIQHIGEIINAPVGAYHLYLKIQGNHLGNDFTIPVNLTVTFSGGMSLSSIKPYKQRDKHIRKIRVLHDDNIVEY